VLSSPEQQESLPPVEDDPSKPFDWFRTPHTAIGVLGGPEEALITPEGYVQNSFGTLQFFTGSTREPIAERIKTWRDGYLPIAQMETTRDGVRISFEYFAAKIPGMARISYGQQWGNPVRHLRTEVDNMVTFVRVRFTNPSDEPVSVTFGTDLGDEVANRGIAASLNSQPGREELPASVSWDPHLGALVGEGRLVLAASRDPDEVAGERLTYRFSLAPGQDEHLVLKLPYWVARASDADALRAADYTDYLEKTVAFWRETLDGADTVLDLPSEDGERKVLDTYKTSIALSLINLDILDGHYFWDANPTIYDHYWIRDTAFNLNGILAAGFHDLAKNVALQMLDYQKENGQFESQANEHDGNGQALWTFGVIYERTRDKDFARRVWPAVQRSMDWQWQFRQDAWEEAGGLFPELFMPDNERVRGHLVGYDLWGIAGERGAATIARAVGEETLAREWEQRADEYERILREKLAPAVEELGWVPPTIEGMDAETFNGTTGWYGPRYGIDWGNLELVWPSGVFDPNERWVTDSLKVWRGKTFEGLFTYPSGGVENTLHSYTPMSISQTYVRNGAQYEALKDMYNLLVHTSATHTTSEGLQAPQRWGWSQGDQTQPHGEFAGKYLSLLRDMLAYERDGSLYLANTLSPAWTRPGQRIGFAGDTDFGRVEYRMEFGAEGATLRLSPPVERAPDRIVVSVPENVAIKSVRLNGTAWKDFSSDRVVLPALTDDAVVTIAWRERRPAPALSYRRAVRDYLANYEKMTSPLDLSLADPRVSRPTVLAGEPVTFTATLRNRGGAGWPDDQPVVYVDGKPVDHEFREISRGIGFTTPDGIISFDQHDGGTVPLTYTTTLCEPGTHTLSVGLAGTTLPAKSVRVRKRPPTAPAPTTQLTLEPEMGRLTVGESTTVTATLTNTGCEAATDVSIKLDTPTGWSVEPTGPTSFDSVEPASSRTVTWTVTPGTPSQETPVTRSVLRAAASYGWRGTTRGSAEVEAHVSVFSPVREPNRVQAFTEAYAGQAGDRFAIDVGGRDMYGSYNEFATIYRDDESTASTVVTTKVTRQTRTGPWAKAGIVLRNDLTDVDSAGYAMVAVTPDNGWVFQWDRDGNGTLESTTNTGTTAYPSWLRLVRQDTTVTGYYSLDGEVWHEVGSVTDPRITAVGDVGLFASAVNFYNPGAISEVEFEGFTVEHPALSVPAGELLVERGGNPSVLPVTVSTESPDSVDGTLTVTGPAGWMIEPASQQVTVSRRAPRTVEIQVAAPADADITSGELTLSFTAGGETARTTVPARLVPPVGDENLALRGTATASSVEIERFAPELAIDGDPATRWSSRYSDDEWLQVELAEPTRIGKVVLLWEAAYGESYDIEVSVDGSSWQTVAEVRGGNGGLDEVRFDPTDEVRFIRMHGVRRAIQAGYSLWEFEIYPSEAAGSATFGPA
jgi:hypothetical protein